MLDSHCYTGFSLVVVSGGYSIVVLHGHLIEVASLVAQLTQASVISVPGL